ncbi:unnamed protein product [Calypogeia fissa]
MEVILPSHCSWRRRKTMQRPPAPFVVKLLLLCFLFFFYYLPSQIVWAQPMPSPDTLALLRFKQQITADPSRFVDNSWIETSLDTKGCPKNWYGVNCSDQGQVITVSLDNLSLEGELVSATLGSLFGLLNLSLANNSFKGTLPDDFVGLSKITTIDFSNNRFVGSIPGSLVNLPSLTNLSLAGNELNGTIPFTLGSAIQDLDLSRNQLEGPIPYTLTQLQKLVALNISGNNLEGSIPQAFPNLLQLQTLDLHGNQLSGSIDSALLALSKIWYVDLSSNNFTGRLPWQLPSTGLNEVQHVNLSHNQLSDTFSAVGVVFTSSLRVLDISYNQLYGELPTFQYASALLSLRLNDNSLSGSIPTTLYQTPSMLTELDLSANLLTGAVLAITSSFLTSINLSNNMLDGTLPASLGQCSSLDLSNNKFHGDVSVMQGWGQILQWLDLSQNQLTGPMADLTPFQQLIYLNFSQNQLSGSLPDPFGSSQVLSVLDLSYNQFGGKIPHSFFYSSLTSLSLSRNQFSGSIPISDNSTPSSVPASPLVSPSRLQVPSDTTQLSPLTLLDLSSNGLTGPIPGKLGSISTLQILNLSNNSLSGQIPSQLDGLSSLRDLDLSMNQLTGPIPPLLPSSLTQLNVSRNNLSGPIPKSLSRFPSTSFYPGNPLLTGLGNSPPRSPSRSDDSKSKVKAGLIGGITAGAVVVFLIGVFIYWYKYPKSKGSSPADDEFGASQRGFEQFKTPSGRLPPEFEGDLERGAAAALPVVAAGKSVNSRKGKSSPSKAGSPEPKVNDIVERDAAPTDNQRLPSVTEDVLSPEHPLVSKVSPEHPLEEKVHSPEQLVGDVFFLDKTLSFSAEDLSRAPAEVLGRSNHGTSYKATLDDDHVLVVKWLKVELAKSRKEFGIEAKKFGTIKHQNIISMKGFYWGPREHEKLILSEYVVGGSLADRLQEGTGPSLPPLTWPQRLKVAVDVSRGLLYLHTKHKWPHGNIKASNILLTEDPNFEALLSDFSLHRLMTPAGIENQVVNSGALGYCAPELSVGRKLKKPSLKSDVFSFGVILMELITGKSAGDIVSASTGIVDLPDWVKVVANEGHAIDCYDTALVGVDRDLEPPNGIEKVLALSLSCAAPQSSRPSMRVVHEGLAAININPD